MPRKDHGVGPAELSLQSFLRLVQLVLFHPRIVTNREQFASSLSNWTAPPVADPFIQGLLNAGYLKQSDNPDQPGVLVLTDQTVAILTGILDAHPDRLEQPRWDKADGSLWLNGQLVKRCRHDAANQRAVLDAFEGQKWPRWIDDPLPATRRGNRKRRRYDTVAQLNDGQGGPFCVRFHAEGGGYSWATVVVATVDQAVNGPGSSM